MKLFRYVLVVLCVFVLGGCSGKKETASFADRFSTPDATVTLADGTVVSVQYTTGRKLVGIRMARTMPDGSKSDISAKHALIESEDDANVTITLYDAKVLLGDKTVSVGSMKLPLDIKGCK